MRVCVAGLWHLGVVTAACLASVGHDIAAFDEDGERITELRSAQLPVAEPGLEELVRAGLESGRLSFFDEPGDALAGADVLWIAYDTPVDDDDLADVDFVVARAAALMAALPEQAFVIVSSQLPVGTTRRFERERIAYVPENLRLGSAIEAFMSPDRVVVGIDSERDRALVARLLAPVTDRVEWMGFESAEMTKHALNAFLATSVTFANEIATLCERVGADAHEVARGLKTDVRIGPRAYLSPGPAFAGGTLARDVEFLTETAALEGVSAPLLSAVRPSNEEHRQWPRRTVESLLNGSAGPVAVWGLAYKVGTDTLRRSSALTLCLALAREGVTVRTHDPAVRALPPDVPKEILLCSTAAEALDDAAALVVATPWPQFRDVEPDELVARMRSPNVVDTTGALADTLGMDPRVRYVTVGKAPQ
jgi:UDPglucose 6-dehydrogenase